MNQKYSDDDYQLWIYLYVKKRFSSGPERISDQINVPVSTIKKHLKKINLLRTNQESKKGRIPWNRGKKSNQIPWNKGMKGQYPYPSPFFGKESPTKNVPRNIEVKQKIAKTLRSDNFVVRVGMGLDFIKNLRIVLAKRDLCYLKKDNQFFYKIGRTFRTPKERCGKQLVKVIKTWQSSHYRIVEIERQVLITFQDQYGLIAPQGVSGRTECFQPNLPLDEVCQFIDMAISSQAKGTPLDGSETTGEVKSS